MLDPNYQSLLSQYQVCQKSLNEIQDKIDRIDVEIETKLKKKQSVGSLLQARNIFVEERERFERSLSNYLDQLTNYQKSLQKK